MGKGFQGIWISNGSRAQRGEAQEVKCIEGAWDPRGGFHAPLYFRFETWKRTAKGNTKEAKAVPPHPPPWFPPLDSLFRGAPSARNDQRGKPIPTTARKAKMFSPTPAGCPETG